MIGKCIAEPAENGSYVLQIEYDGVAVGIDTGVPMSTHFTSCSFQKFLAGEFDRTVIETYYKGDVIAGTKVLDDFKRIVRLILTDRERMQQGLALVHADAHGLGAPIEIESKLWHLPNNPDLMRTLKDGEQTQSFHDSLKRIDVKRFGKIAKDPVWKDVLTPFGPYDLTEVVLCEGKFIGWIQHRISRRLPCHVVEIAEARRLVSRYSVLKE